MQKSSSSIVGKSKFSSQIDYAEKRRSFSIVYDFKLFLTKCKADFEEKYDEKSYRQTAIKLDDYDLLRTLGVGSFGRVLLIKKKKTNLFYAMKVLEKGKVIQSRQLQHSLNEKKILLSIHFPFVVHMYHSIKDNSYIYFIMPFIPGGEMFTHLRQQGKFEERLAQFYTAQVVLALQYLHFLGLVYRDLKPENILIDKNGYLKLTDFGFCKLLRDRTYTLCGTPEYLAPEIILNKGYGKTVDWWSTGVLIFEMTVGYPPFFSRDTMRIYDKILAGKYKFPTNLSPEVKDLIKNLLQNDVTKRFGNLRNGIDDIKNHKWFKGLDWLQILNQSVEPPFVPKVKSLGDASHFDKYDEEYLRVSTSDKYSKEFYEF